LHDRDLGGAVRAADAAVWAVLDRVEARAVETDGNGAWSDGSAWSRAEVHQATGMLMAQAGLAAREALSWLRAYAFSTGRGITEVAGDVVARRLRLRAGGGWRFVGSGVEQDRVQDIDDTVDPDTRDDEGNRS
jgi:hypothetical protein